MKMILPRIFRWRLPKFTQVPYKETASYGVTPASGWFETVEWDGMVPDTDKAFLALTIVCKNVGTSATIAVTYGIDGAATTTSLSTFNSTSNVQTKYFHSVTTPQTNAVGKSIKLKFTFAKAAYNTTPPKLYAFGLHSTLRPDPVKSWELYVRVEDEATLETGYRNPEDAKTVLSSLATLETQVYPIVLREDLDNDLTYTETTVYIVDREKVAVGEADGRPFEIHRLVLQEADTS